MIQQLFMSHVFEWFSQLILSLSVFLAVITFPCFIQVKKHIKQGQGHEGGIFTVEAPLHVSNVQVIDPVTGFGSILNCYWVLMFCLELEH